MTLPALGPSLRAASITGALALSLASAGCVGVMSVEGEPDETAPRLTVTEPAEGTFVEGDTLLVRGTVDDETAVTVLVGDVEATVNDDGTFFATIPVEPGAHRYRVVATDRGDNRAYAFAAAVTGHFEPAGATIDNAAALTIGPGALTEAGDVAGRTLTRLEFDQQLTDANPIASGFWGRADILSEDHGTATVTITPRTGSLALRVSIADLRVDGLIDPRFGGDAPAVLLADAAVVTATARLSSRDGLPDVNVTDLNVSLEGFSFDVSGLPSSFENSAVVRDNVRRKVEEEVEKAALDILRPMLEDFVSRVPTEGRVEVLGTGVQLSTGGFEIVVDAGGVWAAADLSLAVGSPDAERAALGVLVGLSDPAHPPDHDSDLAVDASVDLLNAAAFGAWQSRLFEAQQQRIADATANVTVAQLGLLFPRLTRGMDQSAPVEIELGYPLPPVVSELDGQIVLSVADLRVGLFVSEGGARTELATLSVGVSAALDARFGDAGLAISPGEITITADPVSGSVGLPGPRLDALLTSVLGPLTDQLSTLGTIPVPTVAGFQLVGRRVSAESGYLGLEGSARYTN